MGTALTYCLERRLAWVLLLAGGVTMALGAETAEPENYFDPLPREAPAVRKKQEAGKQQQPGRQTEAAPEAKAQERKAEGKAVEAESPGLFELPEPKGSARFLAGPGTECENVFADVAERVVSGVVSVTRRDGGASGGGLGSGVLAGPRGYVLTNSHVVEGTGRLRVRLYDGREFDAERVASDGPTDVAVLRIKGPKEELDGIKAIPLGNSDAVRVGEWVVAIGSPYGLSETVTTGIVSAKDRRNTGLSEYGSMIQTDAAINPGNSGGALVNLRGELIGINTAIVSRTGGYRPGNDMGLKPAFPAFAGIGFAIPVNMARKVMEDLLKDGKVTRGWLGITVSKAEAAGSGRSRPGKGARVDAVAKGGPGEKAGLRRGDVIIGMEDKPIRDADDLMNQVALAKPGSIAGLEVMRGKKRMEMDVRLGKRAEKAKAPATAAGEEEGDEDPDTDADTDMGGEEDAEDGYAEDGEGGRLGMAVSKVGPALRKRFALEREDLGALVVTAVESGSGAKDADIRAGDVILQADKRKVATVEALRAVVAKGRKAGRVVLLLKRDGETFRATVRWIPGSA